MHGEAGKGDKRRPSQVPYEEYAENYEHVFGKRVNWWETKEHQEWVQQTKAEIDRLREQSKNEHYN